MFDENTLGYILICFIIVISIRSFYNSDMFQLKCIISTVDGNKYCVRERENMTQAADLLAETTQKLINLNDHLIQKYPDDERVQRWQSNFNPTKITEILPTSEYTAYSENKGSKVAFCLNKSDKESTNKYDMIDADTLMFVALHEYTHIGTKSTGHKDEFWTNFKFVLQEAEKLGIYKPHDYKKESKMYCGTEIKDNPYFDYN